MEVEEHGVFGLAEREQEQSEQGEGAGGAGEVLSPEVLFERRETLPALLEVVRVGERLHDQVSPSRLGQQLVVVDVVDVVHAAHFADHLVQQRQVLHILAAHFAHQKVEHSAHLVGVVLLVNLADQYVDILSPGDILGWQVFSSISCVVVLVQ